MHTVIILSKNPENVRRCAASIEQNQPGTPIVVVWDGSDQYRNPPRSMTVVPAQKPFCFSRNANAGIMAADPSSDVILMNDDAELRTPGGFDKLEAASKSFGVVSASIRGRCCNGRQKYVQDICTTEPDFLAFVCVYIPRSTLDLVGPLDERFVPGTWEDNDYCQRVKLAGLPLGICGPCVVDHNEAGATLERQKDYQQILTENKRRYDDKWRIGQTLLSICVCSIGSRTSYLNRLLSVLQPQFCPQVEFLLSVDHGQQSVGDKRQVMLEAAKGEFIVFLDDDDLVPPHYIRRVLAAINSNRAADCITYLSTRFDDGVFEANCSYSLKNARNDTHIYVDGIKQYLRFPYHVTPIRTSIARKVGFKNLNFREDTVFSEEIRPLLKAEVFIPEVMYEYWWRSNKNRVGEVTNKDLLKEMTPTSLGWMNKH